MKQFSVVKLLLLLLLLICGACRKNDNSTRLAKDDLTLINEAKNYFQSEVAPTNSGKLVELGAGEYVKIGDYPVWEYARVSGDSLSKKAVIIPLLTPFQYASVKGGAKLPLLTRSSLVIYSDPSSKLHAEVRTRIPDENSSSTQFSGLVLYRSWDGKPIRSFLFKEGRKYRFSSSGIKNSPVTTESTAPYYECYDIDHYTCVTVGSVDFPCTYEYTTTNCVLVSGSGGGGGGGGSGGGSTGGGGGGGTSNGPPTGTHEPPGNGWPYPVTLKPGDRLCPRSFNYTNQSATGAYYLTNMIGLTIEDGTNRHVLPETVYSLTNGISETAMKGVNRDDFFGLEKTPLQYLKDHFSDLFYGDITRVYQDGQYVYKFTPKAAAIISARVSSFASDFTVITTPGAAMPSNPLTNPTFYEMANSLIKTFMPGSAIFPGHRSNASTSNAAYEINCQW